MVLVAQGGRRALAGWGTGCLLSWGRGKPRGVASLRVGERWESNPFLNDLQKVLSIFKIAGWFQGFSVIEFRWGS